MGTTGSGLDRLIGGTRAEILRLLRPRARTAAEMAAALGLTATAVRAHLAGLERDGWVAAAGGRRATGGKPAQLYELTAAGEELFPKAYAQVLNAVLNAVAEHAGDAEKERLLRATGARIGAAYAREDFTLVERIRTAADVLRSLGGDVKIEEDARGWLLHGDGCPLSSAVSAHVQVCTLVQSLLKTITGQPVRERCRHAGRPRCAFQVAAPTV